MQNETNIVGQSTKLVGYGVDTLILNVRYPDKKGQPVKQELEEKLTVTLDYLQGEARSTETCREQGSWIDAIPNVV